MRKVVGGVSAVGNMLKTCAIALALLLIISPSVSGQTDEKHLIIPGKGIGPVKIGLSEDEVTSATGALMVAPPAGVIEFLTILVIPTGAPNGRLIVLFKLGKVYRVGIEGDASYATAEGVHVGSTEGEVRAAFGEPLNIKHTDDYDFFQYGYYDRGIILSVKEESVVKIFVCIPLSTGCGG